MIFNCIASMTLLQSPKHARVVSGPCGVGTWAQCVVVKETSLVRHAKGTGTMRMGETG